MNSQLAPCYHCEQPIPLDTHFEFTVLEEPRQFCCPGCQAVAQAIVQNELEDYYRFRTEPAEKAQESDQILSQLALYDVPEIQDDLVSKQNDLSSIQLTIEGIRCAACAWLIEKQLLQLPGLERVGVDVSARRTTVVWDDTKLKLSQILTAFEEIGYHAHPFQPDSHELTYQKENKQFLKKLGLSGLMTMQVMMLAFGLYFGVFGNLDQETKHYFHWVSFILTVPVVFYSGSEFYLSALNALQQRQVNMDVPISIAIFFLFVASGWATVNDQGQVYFESVCMFIFLLLISRYLEHNSRKKAATASANSNKHIPITARLIRDNVEEQCLARKVDIGQTVRVKPGEFIPVDGQILSGESLIDEAMLTGEFLPIQKQPGDKVYAGTLNQAGSFDVRVTSKLKDSVIQQISRLQELALGDKPKSALIADKLAKIFVMVVLAVSAGTYIYWSLHNDPNAIWYTVAVLVATCPCALGLATPTALTAAMAKLHQHGILLKRSSLLESINDIQHLVFDKTGTLTEGKISMSELINVSNMSDEEVLDIAANLESFSEHPIAEAFNVTHPKPVTNQKNHLGLGVSGSLSGQEFRIGSMQFMKNSILEELQHSNVFLENEREVLAGFVLQDQLKDDSKEVVSALKHFHPIILSGDSDAAVINVAENLGIESYKAQCKPQDKLEHITKLQNNNEAVLVIGDGINDAPVLAKADISIAVKNAADLAKNASDVVFLGQQLKNLLLLFQVAKKTKIKVKQNIMWALGYNTFVLPFAVAGMLTPWMGVIGMSLSSILVVANSTRLLKQEYR